MLQYNDNTMIVQEAKKMLLPISTFTQAYLLIFTYILIDRDVVSLDYDLSID